MRTLIFSENNKKDFDKIIDFIENERAGIVDFFNHINEAEYCSEIRKYDYILIEYDGTIRKYLNMLKEIRDNNPDSEIIFFGKEVNFSNFSKYSKHMKYINSTSKIYEELLEKIKIELNKGKIRINTKTKKIWIKENNIETELELDASIDFYILVYFIRHYNEKINIDRLLDAVSKEPELTKNSIAESSISSIRKVFKKAMGKNPITSFKKVGYCFSI